MKVDDGRWTGTGQDGEPMRPVTQAEYAAHCKRVLHKDAMKALSIRQPWCHAILELGKRVENRDWAGCAYRGPVLLHAAKTLVLRPRKGEPVTFGDAIESILDVVSDERDDLLDPIARWDTERRLWRPAPGLPFGGIVGRARIAEWVKGGGTHAAWGLDAPIAHEALTSPWYAGGFALVLTDVEPLPFIPWQGSLGLFECDMP